MAEKHGKVKLWAEDARRAAEDFARLAAACALIIVSPARAAQFVCRCIASEQLVVRSLALVLVPYLGPWAAAAAGAVSGALLRPCEQTRVLACGAVAKLGAAAAACCGPLAGCLSDGRSTVQQAARTAVIAMGPVAAPVLRKLFFEALQAKGAAQVWQTEQFRRMARMFWSVLEIRRGQADSLLASLVEAAAPMAKNVSDDAKRGKCALFELLWSVCDCLLESGCAAESFAETRGWLALWVLVEKEPSIASDAKNLLLFLECSGKGEKRARPASAGKPREHSSKENNHEQ